MRTLRFAALIVPLLCLGIAVASGQTADELGKLRQQAKQLFDTGRYAEALATQRAVAAGTERTETARSGTAGKETAYELVSLSWYALFARTPVEAVDASERALKLIPALWAIDSNRAHALLLLGRTDEARKLYLAHKGKRISAASDETWEDAIAKDFDALRAAGIVHEAFPEIVAQLGVEHPELNRQLEATFKNFEQLYGVGKYHEAAAAAETLVDLARRRYGEGRTEFAGALSWLAASKAKLNQTADAVALLNRSLAIREKALGSEHPGVAQSLNNLASLYQAQGRYAEAEPLYRRSLAIYEKALGPDHPDVAQSFNNLALLYWSQGRYAEAEPLYRRSLAIREKALGAEHPDVAHGLNNLATLYRDQGHYAEAEPLYRRGLAIYEKALGPDHPVVVHTLNNLAELHRSGGRFAEAEPLYRRALAIDEKSLGPDHPNVARDLNHLALLLQDTNRLDEAEPLFRRALAVDEKSLGPDHPEFATALNNLAALLKDTNRLAEAEPLIRRVLAIGERSLGPDHPNIAKNLSNLAQILWATNRVGEAEPVFRRALAIEEKNLGSDHPSVAIQLIYLAGLLRDTNRFAEAEPLLRRALSIDERSLGPDHRRVASRLNNLAALRAELGDWIEAAQLHRRAVPIMTGARADDASYAKAELAQSTWNLRAATRAVHRAGGDRAHAREEGFELAQWALQTGAADALAQMSVRFAKGAGPLAAIVRERQDLIARRQAEDKRLLAAIGKADAKTTDAGRAAIADVDSHIASIDTRLTSTFPEYAQLSNPRPLTIAGVQGLLKEDEALVVFLDVPRMGSLPEETLAWAVTKGAARWASIPLGTDALGQRVRRLRCGLDREGQWRWNGQRQRWMPNGETCEALKPDGLSSDEPLPFDVGTAHELYAALLGPFVDLIKGKSLIVVPSGPLTSLPFHVLVGARPSGSDSLAGGAAVTPITWLALTQPVTVLPSVGSLAALRKLPPAQASEPYIAFGNPLLEGGAPEQVRLTRAKQTCSRETETAHRGVADAARGVPGLGSLFRSGVNIAALRAQAPLPETADELCAVAKTLGALGHEADTVWLGARATESNVKALSRSGQLAHYRVLHFATHGVLAGESEAILKASAEPALILTPPKDDTSPAELVEDDGLLTASEVAELELDADWVVLSACNTAAGDKGDAEALSGLARAFFYAKARALLVSHWYVNSEAAVSLTTGAFAELSAHPEIGRAEALRRSMARLITSGNPDEAQPEYWAPFVLVGGDTH
jgi:tetratricopeptide (TPR) repeat protein/CHAT domain-containing protein